jgi:hypothetical protein
MCKSLVFGLVAKLLVYWYGDQLSPQSPASVAGILCSRLFGPSSEADSFCLWHFVWIFANTAMAAAAVDLKTVGCAFGSTPGASCLISWVAATKVSACWKKLLQGLVC